MSVFGSVFIAMLAALGIALTILELLRICRTKRSDYICICFREELLESEKPDIVVVVRTEEDIDEVIRRFCVKESRKTYIKRI